MHDGSDIEDEDLQIVDTGGRYDTGIARVGMIRRGKTRTALLIVATFSRGDMESGAVAVGLPSQTSWQTEKLPPFCSSSSVGRISRVSQSFPPHGQVWALAVANAIFAAGTCPVLFQATMFLAGHSFNVATSCLYLLSRI